MSGNFRIQFLGQSGFLIEAEGSRLLIDPYLSNSVAETFGDEFQRLVKIPVSIEKLPAVDLVLVTHAHHDHCDCKTLAPLVKLQPKIKIAAPPSCLSSLKEGGIPDNNIQAVSLNWNNWSKNFSFRAVEACHPEIEYDGSGVPVACGYIIRLGAHTIYHAGDTSPHEKIIQSVLKEKVSLGLVPINERNYFKERKGIVGNMSCLEALQFSQEIALPRWVPMHWDMFDGNSVDPQEMKVILKHHHQESKVEWMNAGEFLNLNSMK